jgi:hypothetical protein
VTEEPISVPPYRLAPNRREILKKEINKMLDEMIIEPCSMKSEQGENVKNMFSRNIS